MYLRLVVPKARAADVWQVRKQLRGPELFQWAVLDSNQ